MLYSCHDFVYRSNWCVIKFHDFMINYVLLNAERLMVFHEHQNISWIYSACQSTQKRRALAKVSPSDEWSIKCIRLSSWTLWRNSRHMHRDHIKCCFPAVLMHICPLNEPDSLRRATRWNEKWDNFYRPRSRVIMTYHCCESITRWWPLTLDVASSLFDRYLLKGTKNKINLSIFDTQ